MSARALATALVLTLLLVPACRTARVYEVEDQALGPAPLEQREAQIARAARMQGWSVETLEPGVMIATKRLKKHVASTTVVYDEDSFSLALRNSVSFKQSGDRIHKLYNAWVEDLETAIRREASAPGYDAGAVSSGPNE